MERKNDSRSYLSHMTVKYINSFASKEEHSQVNASFLLMLSLIYKSVDYYGSKDAMLVMEKVLGSRMPDNVIQHGLFVYRGHSRIALLLRYLISAIQNILLLIGNRNEIIFYNFDNVFSIRIINWLNRFLHRKVVVLCHGELELLRQDIKKEGPLQRMIMFLVRNFYNKNVKFADMIYFIVLGESIKSNLSKFLTKEQLAHFYTIDHPYIVQSNCYTTPSYSSSNKIKVGCVGSMNELKGTKRLIELANEVELRKIDVEISVIGKVFSDREELLSHNVILKSKDNRSLPYDEFQRHVSELDAILFLYDMSSYKLTASGAIYDSIIFSKPIITLRNDYFDYIISKYGIPALIATDVGNMAMKIESIRNFDENLLIAKYKSMLKNISPSVQAKHLYSILNKIGL